MSTIQTLAEAVSRLDALFQKTDERDEALLAYIKQLASENEQLKRSLHKLRTNRAMKNSSETTMHSKLTDALRE